MHNQLTPAEQELVRLRAGLEHAKQVRKTAWSCLGSLVFLFVGLPLMSIFEVIVLTDMWKWYVTPGFNVPVPAPWVLFGLVITIGLLWHGKVQSHKDDPEKAHLKKNLLAHWSETVYFWLAGWGLGWLGQKYGPTIASWF